jgi:FAD/FMN-containing dehydrogenase
MAREKTRYIERMHASMMKLMTEPFVDISDETRNQIIDELREAMAPDRVSAEPHILAYYRGSEFTIGAKMPKPGQPHIVVYPKSNEDIKSILRIASAYRVPVTACGLQSTQMSNRAYTGGILIDLMSMDKVLKIDTDQGYVVVEPGATINQVQKEILPRGYTLAKGTYYPSMSIIATLVAWLGQHNFVNRMMNQVIGLEVVTPDGSTILTGSELHGDGEVWTDVQGSVPMLTGLFMPTSTSIGIITKAAIRIWPTLEARAIPFFGFEDFGSALRWSHAMSKSSMADALMNLHWNYVAGMNYKLTGRYLDYLEARANLYQEESPRNLGLYPWTSFVQLRGYEEEVRGAVETATRLGKSYGGVYMPEDEVSEKLPYFYKYMVETYKDYRYSDVDTSSMLHETPMFTDQFIGTIEELIDLERGIRDKFQDYNIKNWGCYTRHVNSGQTTYYRFFTNCDYDSQEQVSESVALWGDVTEWALENYDVSVIVAPFRYNDPENPEQVEDRAKPVRRLMSAVQNEFDPEGILVPALKKYILY